MKPKLLIISDLFGFENSTWIKRYLVLLESHFQLQLYDSIELAEIDKTNLSPDQLHSVFVNGGIEKAVKKLFSLEKEEVNILAFSIGGTIGWKAGLLGLDIKHFYAVSSTRLRYESMKPNSIINLIFGENDINKPDKAWFLGLNLKGEILKNGNHEIYRTHQVMNDLCERIKLAV